MFGLTQLGMIHTAISLVAVAAGLIALVRDKEISPRNMLGKVYVITTVLVCLTGFGIFQHGGSIGSKTTLQEKSYHEAGEKLSDIARRETPAINSAWDKASP